MIKFSKDNLQTGNKQRSDVKIYDMTLKELAEREDQLLHNKDEMCMISARESPEYVNRLVTDVILASSGWDVRDKLSRKKVFLYTAKLGSSIIAHSDIFNSIERKYTEISAHCTDEDSIAYANLDSRPPSLARKISASENGNVYNVFERTRDWISNSAIHLGMNQCDLCLYCVSVGFAKLDQIPNPLHKKQLDQGITVFEKYMKRREQILSLDY